MERIMGRYHELLPGHSCDVALLFPGAEEILKQDPIGWVEQAHGGHSLPLRTAYWGIADDPLDVQGCVMALTEFLDGSPVAVRYRASDVHEFSNVQEECYFLSLRRQARGAESIYHPIARHCACKGTGLVPPNVPKGTPQAFCPVHRCQRYWPQQQKDGSTQFKRLGPGGLIE